MKVRLLRQLERLLVLEPRNVAVYDRADDRDNTWLIVATIATASTGGIVNRSAFDQGCAEPIRPDAGGNVT